MPTRRSCWQRTDQQKYNRLDTVFEGKSRGRVFDVSLDRSYLHVAAGKNDSSERGPSISSPLYAFPIILRGVAKNSKITKSEDARNGQ